MRRGSHPAGQECGLHSLDLAFNVDRAEAIPGDVLTYTATVTNTGATLTLSGTFTVENISDVVAMVAYYDDLVDYQPTTGEGWTPLAGAAAALPGYSPVSPALLTRGITLTATGRPAPGVVYPTSGDGITGTQIEPGGVAVWDYQATLSISAEQIGLLLDSERVRDVRNTAHFEVTPRLAERGQPFIEHLSIIAPLRTQSGDLTDGRLTLTLPNNEQTVFNSTTTPALAILTPGASAAIEATYPVPMLADKGADETDEAYLARLGEADGAGLSATAEATLTSHSGAVSAPPRTAITTQHVPIVTLLKSGPETVEAGQSVTYELTLTNIGSAVARELALEDRLPNRDLGLIDDVPVSLEPGARATAHASHTVPNTQPPGDLTDIASVVWEDANDNVYGPVSDTFTTEVLSPLPEGTLTLAPAFAGPNVTGIQQTLVATLKDTNGVPLPGVTIRFTVSGPNATSGEAVTAADGTAAFTYTGTNHGFDSVQATAVLDSVVVESNTATVHWVTPTHTVTTSTIWGRFFTADNSGIFKTPPTQAPVFDLAFPSINFNPPAGTVPGNTSGVGVNTRPFTNVTMDLNGNYAGTIVAQGNGYQAGVGPLFTFSAVFTGEFTVAAEGNAIFDFFSDDGFIFGIGNGAQRVGGANTNPPPSGLTPFEGYPVMGAYNRPTAPVRNSITVYFPAPGTYPFEIDYTECCGGQLALTLAVRETGFGITPVGSLVISPNSTQTRLTGQEQAFTVTAQDASGLPLTDLMVMLRVSGANTQELAATTDASGAATFTYTGYNVGTDVVQAVAWAQGDVAAYSAEVKVNWQRGTSPPTDPATPLAIPGWIGSPTNQSTLTGQVPIRLRSGINLQTGTIDYWPADDPGALTILATNVSGSGGATLATFDTTKLANGSYIIRLQGTDTSGNQVNSGVLVTVQGEYKPGRVRFTLTDLTVPVVGLPITVGRTYDSLERNRVGDFGYGWSLAIGNPRLEQDPAHNVTLTMPDGKRVTFYFKPQSAGGVFGFLFYPRYLPEAGVYGSLSANGCGLLVISGGQYYCFPGGYYAPTEFTYTDPYGRKFLMSSDGRLKSITDLNGNVLTFTPDGITSSAGVSVAFARDAQGRITTITDPAGQEYRYEYDAEGNLQKVFLPSVGQQSSVQQYSYSSDHFFQEMLDPRGNRPVITTYDSAGRVQTITDAAGNQTAYEYDLAGHRTIIHHRGDPADPNDDLGDTILVYDEAGYLISHTDPLGHTTTYAYDGNHNLTSIADPLSREIRYTYNADGHPTSIIDPLGNTLGTVEYNRYGGPTQLTTIQGNNATVGYDPVTFMPLSASDNLGFLGSYTWTAQGNPASYTNPYGETTHYTYTPQGYVETETDPLGHVTHYAYDAFGRVIEMTTAYGTAEASTTRYEYDALGRQIAVTTAFGTDRAATTRYEYDANGNRTAVIDPLGRRTEYEYDAANRLIRVTYAAHAPAEASVTTYAYDVYGRLTDVTTAAGTSAASTTHYEYDAAGRVTDLTTAYGTVSASTTHYEYYADGRVANMTTAYNTADASTTHYEYDAAGRLTDLTTAYGTPAASTTHYEYYASGLMKSMTTAYGTSVAATTRYFYDARGRPTLTEYPDGTSSVQRYDIDPAAPGWTDSTTDPSGVTTKQVYDAAGRLQQLVLSAVDPATGQTLEQVTRYEYDAAGRLTTVHGPSSTVQFTYYPDGLLHTRTAWLDASTAYTTTYEYNLAGEQIAVQDAKGFVTRYEYNARGLLTKTLYPGNITTTQTYDAAGRLIASTDENGILTRSDYDAAGRLIGVTLAADIAEAITIRYGYDSAGRLTSLTDALGRTTRFEYDAAGHQVKKIWPDGSTFEQFEYDAAGNRIAHRLADGNVNTFAYDALNRLTRMDYFDGQSVRFEYTPGGARKSVSIYPQPGAAAQTYRYDYDPFQRLKQVTYPDGRFVAYTYDAAGNRQTMTTSANGQTSTVQYTYDALNRLIAVRGLSSEIQFTYDPLDLLTEVRLGNGVTGHYTYDALGRLTSIDYSTGDSFHYTLDPAGNRLREESTVNGQTSTVDYTYDALNRLIAVRGLSSEIQFTYDGRGNLTTVNGPSSTVTYTWDAADRLIAVRGLPSEIQFTYDADGRRVAVSGPSSTVHYTWDEASPYGDVVLETSGSSSTSYLLAGSQLLAQERDGIIRYYLRDGQGSTRTLTDSSGNITDSYTYTAFGELLSRSGASPNAYLYTGQQYDAATGLYYLRARYYDPALGRFLSRDAYPYVLANPVELNRYVYAANNPVTWSDPSGYQTFVEYETMTPLQKDYLTAKFAEYAGS